MLTIRCQSECAAFAELRPVWKALLQQSRSDGIFLTHEWQSTWLDVFGRDFQLMLLTAADEGQLVGLAPLMIGGPAGGWGAGGRTLMFLGQRTTTPEYMDFIAHPGREAEIAAAFADYLVEEKGGDWDSLFLENMLADSPTVAALTQALARHGIPVSTGAENPAPYARLEGNFEAFLRGRSPGFREQYLYSQRRLHRQGTVRYLFAGQDVSVDEALEAVIRLNHDRWQDEGTSFRSEKNLEFHRRLCRRIGPLGWLALVLVQLEDTTVAARYDYVYAGKLWAFQGGWSRSHERLGLGHLATGRLIEWGLERGLREYDFLGGAAPYKSRWSTHQRTLVGLHAYNRTWKGQALRLAHRGRNALRNGLPPGLLRRLGNVRRWLRA